MSLESTWPVVIPFKAGKTATASKGKRLEYQKRRKDVIPFKAGKTATFRKGALCLLLIMDVIPFKAGKTATRR